MRNLENTAPEHYEKHETREISAEQIQQKTETMNTRLEEIKKEEAAEKQYETLAIERHWKQVTSEEPEIAHKKADEINADKLIAKTTQQIQDRWGKNALDAFSTELFS